ncbi:MAG TPA: L,D-transpeptidase family protein [Thermoleophilaceae bacterium]|nr:L,D-transpeptidase family protein [Thermoleophilaceae bacterium]
MKIARTALIAGLLALATALPATAAAPKTLPPGATIAGVDVSGLDAADATAKAQAAIAPVWERPVNVGIGGTVQQVASADLGQTVDYAGMVSDAFKQAARHRPVHIRLARTIDGKKLRAEVTKLGKPYYRAPRNSRVVLGVTRIKRIHGRLGRGIDSSKLRQKIIDELRHPTPSRIVHARVQSLRPAVTLKTLARRYATYISVDRDHFKLRLFKRLRLVKTYPIAVGMAGLETPAGIRHVLDKQVNPDWHVPNSPWAGSLAGQTIPSSDPADPLKARWLGLGDGVGIHGTSEDWSIGTRASHGCIRMHVSDVIDLYPRVPIGTPVRIH